MFRGCTLVPDVIKLRNTRIILQVSEQTALFEQTCIMSAAPSIWTREFSRPQGKIALHV